MLYSSNLSNLVTREREKKMERKREEMQINYLIHITDISSTIRFLIIT